MIKQILLPIAGVAIFIVLVGLLTQKSNSLDLSKYFPQAASGETKTMMLSDKTIQVEIVSTESSREKGLSDRSSLPKDSGMLFVFDSKPESASTTFWMKDMLIPLDIIWILDNKIVKIDKNIPAPPAGTPDSSLQTFTAGQEVDYVLEVNGGFSDTNNLKVGDSVTLPVL